MHLNLGVFAVGWWWDGLALPWTLENDDLSTICEPSTESAPARSQGQKERKRQELEGCRAFPVEGASLSFNFDLMLDDGQRFSRPSAHRRLHQRF